jgi:signal transduction histidine kinase
MTAEHATRARAGDGAPTRDGTADRTEFWRRSLRGWDVAFYAMTAVSAASIANARPGAASLAVALGALGLLVVAYTTIGRLAARRGDARLAGAYLAVLIVVVVVVVRAEMLGAVLLFIAYSQIWFFSTTRLRGVLLSTVLTVGTASAMAVRSGADREVLLEIAGQMGVALVFAVTLGLWITQVAEQSEERAGLIERLEAAQAELAEQHHAAGVAAERERFAQDIHDTLAQGFTSVVMLAQTATTDLDRGDPDAARRRLELVETTARENLAEARALVAAFVPVALDGATLVQALHRLADRFRAETGVTVDLDLTDPPGPLPRDVEVVLLRAAQEALANVRRHAHASHVRLRLAAADGTAELEVLDDGLGLPAGTPEGIGLSGMRERVTAGGGDLDVAAAPAGGTRLLVRVPAPGGTGHATDDGAGAA